jgi:hypothetical protein
MGRVFDDLAAHSGTHHRVTFPPVGDTASVAGCGCEGDRPGHTTVVGLQRVGDAESVAFSADRAASRLGTQHCSSGDPARGTVLELSGDTPHEAISAVAGAHGAVADGVGN